MKAWTSCGKAGGEKTHGSQRDPGTSAACLPSRLVFPILFPYTPGLDSREPFCTHDAMTSDPFTFLTTIQ